MYQNAPSIQTFTSKDDSPNKSHYDLKSTKEGRHPSATSREDSHINDKAKEDEKTISLESYLVRKRLKDLNPCHPPLSKVTNQIKYISRVILTTKDNL